MRFGLSRHCSVVIKVPSPSTVSDPPSSTISEGIRSMPINSRTRAVMRASSVYGWNRSPQELNTKSMPARPPSSATTTNGPESRVQESSMGTSRTSTRELQRRRTSRAWSGRVTMMTGSNAAIVLAVAAYST